MKIVFFGTPEFAIPSLKSIASSKHDLLKVITNADKNSGRGLKKKSSPIKSFCELNSIDYISYLDFKSEKTYNELNDMKPDLFVVVAFKILPEQIINIPRYGSINIHPSLLPKYRGSSPIQYAILNGDKKTGVTIFQLNSKIDSGNVIIQKSYCINNDINFSDLYTELSKLGSILLLEAIDLLDKGIADAVPQYSLDENLENKEIIYAKKIKTKDCLIDWNLTAYKINNKIRAFSKNPGAFTFLNNKKIKIFDSNIFKGYNKVLNESTVISFNGILLVGTKDDPLEINLLQIEGKKIVSGKDFTNSSLFINNKIINFG